MLYKCLHFIVQVAENSSLRSEKTATLTHQSVDEPKLKKTMRDGRTQTEKDNERQITTRWWLLLLSKLKQNS